VFHSGYVIPARERAAQVPRGEHLLVSAGGGIVGDTLFRTVLAARERLARPLPLRIVAGPFLPEPHWQALQALCAGVPGVQLVRHVADMVDEMRRARASLSQCGYNTALDLVVAGVPALVVPYETVTENEQRGRAEKLAGLGAMLCLPAGELQPQPLARAIERLLAFTPKPAALALDGAQRSAAWLAERLQARHAAKEPACATN
jgi:predicted glycosyltransferase